MGENEVLDIKQMQELLGWGREKIRAEVRANRLPTPVRRGRKFVWFAKSVEVSIERMRAATERNVKASAFQ